MTSTMGWNAYEKSGMPAAAARCGSSQTIPRGRRMSMSGGRRSACATELLSPATVAKGGQQFLGAAGVDTDGRVVLAEEVVDARQPRQFLARHLVEPHRPVVKVALRDGLPDDERHL